jgi:hypothetical protein
VRRLLRYLMLLALVSALAALLPAVPALASGQQLSVFEDDGQLQSNPEVTLATLRSLGVGVIRVSVPWGRVAPASRPASFQPSDPGDPHYNWAIFDRIDRAAQANGITADFTLDTPAPAWSLARGVPPGSGSHGQWKPNATEFGAFVRAVGARYSGHFTPAGDSSPLPRISFWAIWNEPNFGQDLGPQATKGSSVLYAPVMYRTLLDDAWSSLRVTGHSLDTIVIGSLAARGTRSRPSKGIPDGRPGNFGTTKPLQFVRALYCVDSRNRPLTGSAAAAESCPTTASASKQFRAAHPALFSATGFAVHPYPVNRPPTQLDSRDPDYAQLPDLPHVTGVLDAVQRTYRSHTRYPIYITEFGYITSPPNRSNDYPSPATAAYWINWSEYLMWRNPRVATSMQFLLEDPNPRVSVPEFGGFADGLEFYGGKPKPAYNAYRMPLYLPSTRTRRGRNLEVWGAIRPAHFAQLDTHASQRVQIQFQRGSRGTFTTIKTVTITNARGYFDVKVTFAASGAVRLGWSSPAQTSTLYSRTEKVTVR